MKIAAGVLVQNPDNPNLFLSIIKDRNNPSGGCSLPCGKLESNELPYQAAQRECLEETGYTIQFPMLMPFVHKNIKDGFMVWIYLSHLSEDILPIKPKDPKEGEVVWSTIDDLLSGPYADLNRLALINFGFIKS